MIPVLDRMAGPDGRAALLARAGIFELPDGSEMIPETVAARLHRQVRLEEPELAPLLAQRGGRATADYILANRIPMPAQMLLKALPPSAAAVLLSRAIAQHAWTFVGSGEFRVVTPWIFEIKANPLIRGETSEGCLCHWHAGVFGELYRSLVARDCTCREVACGAQSGSNVCRFELERSGTS